MLSLPTESLTRSDSQPIGEKGHELDLQAAVTTSSPLHDVAGKLAARFLGPLPKQQDVPLGDANAVVSVFRHREDIAVKNRS